MASTEKKTSLEPSEIFCAVGLLIPTKKMNDLVQDNTGAEVLKWAADAGLKKAKAEIKPLDAKFVKMFQNAGDEKFLTNYKKRNDLVANIVAGFSAAIGIKDFMKVFGDTNDIMSAVFMTGAQWPAKVDKFRLKNEKSGFDYNSSDLVVEYDEDTYYGISLKKKKNVQAADPTLINKAYSTFLEGLDTQREELNKKRIKYFPNVVKAAQKDGIITLRGLESMTNEEIWDYKVLKPNGKDKVALINLKGFNENDDPIDLTDVDGTIDQATIYDAPKGRMGLRDYINRDLADPKNKLYKGFDDVLKKRAGHFASNLIDITLKTKMATKLVAKDLEDMHFEFALVTGFADYSPNKKDATKDKLILKPAKVIPQHSVLCGLANLAGKRATYFLELDKQKKLESNAAKLFYKLGIKSKGKSVTVLDVQLRYKGDFKQAPQFFATISDEFITQIHEKCLVRT